MAKPIYLVVPSSGMKEYENFDKLFSFYPDGVRGLVKDYLSIYADPEYLTHLAIEDDVSLQETLKASEKELFDKVMQRYEQTEEYLTELHTNPLGGKDFLVQWVCEEVSQRASDLVEEHIDVFSKFRCEIDELQWMGDSVVLKAHKFIPSWFYPPGPRQQLV